MKIPALKLHQWAFTATILVLWLGYISNTKNYAKSKKFNFWSQSNPIFPWDFRHPN